MATQNEPHDEPDHTIPVEIPAAGIGAGTVGLASVVMVNFVDITPSPLADAIIIGAAGIVGGGYGARKLVQHALATEPRADSKITDQACTAARVAAWGSSAWVALNQYCGDISPGSVMALVAGAAVSALAAWTFRRRIAGVTDDVLKEQQRQQEQQREREHMGDWGTILRRAGFTRTIKAKSKDEDDTTEMTVGVIEQGEIHDSSLGQVIGVYARVTAEPSDFENLFYEAAERKIGNAAGKVLGDAADVTTNSVMIERERKQGYARINVLTTDIMSGKIPFALKAHEVGAGGHPLPSDPTQPVDVGRHPNGNRALIKKWRRHMEVLGESQSGKSSLANILFERWTRSDRHLVWLGAQWKLNRLTDKWLEGMTYQGGNNPCVFDWVAPTQRRTLEMLATALEEASNREADPEFLALGEDNPTPEYPAVDIVIEEASDTLKDEAKIRCHDGKNRNASELVDKLTSGATSAMIHVTMMTQTALMADLGEVGNRIKGNVSVSIAFKSGRNDHLTKVVPTVSPLKNETHLGNPGSFYLQQPGAPGWLSKADFIERDVIPAMAAARGHMAGTLPKKSYERFWVGTKPDDKGNPTQPNAYARRFSFGQGSREEFLEAVRKGAESKEKAMATSAAGRGNGDGPKPGTVEHDQKVLGLDPNMSMEAAVSNMNKVCNRAKVERQAGDQQQVDATFAQIAGAIGDIDTGGSGGDDEPPEESGPSGGGGLPAEVATILEAADGFDTITTSEVAIILGLLDENEDDTNTIEAASRSAAERVYKLLGLRTDQPRDRQGRHGTRRPRGYRVAKVQAAADELR